MDACTIDMILIRAIRTLSNVLRLGYNNIEVFIMAYTDKKQMYNNNNRLNRENYDRISLMVKHGRKILIKQAADKTGESVNRFISRLIDAELERLGIDTAIDQEADGANCGNSTPPVDSDTV